MAERNCELWPRLSRRAALMKSLLFGSRLLMLLVGVPLMAAMTGCGGGGGTSPDPGTSGPAIVDNALTNSDFRDSKQNRYYDIFVCDVKQSGVASVEMRSVGVDANVLVYRKNSKGEFDLIGENDDISDQNTDARVEFDVSRGKSYRIIATSAGADERGDYSLYFSQNLGRPARVLPDANRTAQGGAAGVTLPPAVKKGR